MENNALKCYGHVVRMEDKKWPKQIMTFSPREYNNHDLKWDKEMERVMKQSNQWTTGKLID